MITTSTYLQRIQKFLIKSSTFTCSLLGTTSHHFVTFAYDRDNIMNNSPYAVVYFMRKINYGQANCSVF
ncbi:hypothetical protein KY290_022857 [Solanum tuberosum]|uniref:Uncharacterized protein n=1 Tax=Solanum tuberosum TaxID=4113 RepID=A0ABQ7V5L6_SOLTU|nr:hypothetical protein KY284_021911 [Solanum tuberosum]KAH0684182.1 hypothetical protein KY289_021934 [Solanum tuberosum]KAH0694573.1 hypothetical protein KY285_021670 [Solanum tuberosum]KAH0759364.1 hypothetical protein KY290_022857 [Solanum tuberosum]